MSRPDRNTGVAGPTIVGFDVLKRAALFVFACVVVLAIWKSVPHDDAGTLLDWAKEKAGQVEVWSDKTSDSIVDKTEQIPAPSGILPENPDGVPAPEVAETPTQPPPAG